MRRFRLWLARKLVPDANIFVRTPNSAPVAGFTTLTGCTFTNATAPSSAVWYATHDGDLFNFKDGEVNLVAKKKKRTKAAGKAAAKNKQENKAKAKGGKGAR